MSGVPPPGDTQPMPDPPPGWYADPANPALLRYWDGRQWTTATNPAPAAAWGPPGRSFDNSGWGQPQGAAPGSGPVMPAYASYVPQTAPLAASGMRRVSELFNDAGRIIRRAWWPITAVSLVVWLLWTAVVVLIGLMVVDVSKLQGAMRALSEAWTKYPGGKIPSTLSTSIGQAFSDSIRVQSPVVWVVLGVIVALGFLFVICFQLASVNRFAMDGASGEEVRFGNGIRSGFTGGIRLLGYVILLTLAYLIMAALVVLLIWATSSVPALAITLAILGYLAILLVSIFVGIRLIPMSAQVVVDRGALAWSWRATRPVFWAVLGRYLLWSLVASLVANILLSVVSFPIGLLYSAAMASTDPTTGISWVLGSYLILLPLTMAVSALTMIGVVPIWRDLTDHPVYRSIGPDGLPIVVPKSR